MVLLFLLMISKRWREKKLRKEKNSNQMKELHPPADCVHLLADWLLWPADGLHPSADWFHLPADWFHPENA